MIKYIIYIRKLKGKFYIKSKFNIIYNLYKYIYIYSTVFKKNEFISSDYFYF